jgi:hypothetical protein
MSATKLATTSLLNEIDSQRSFAPANEHSSQFIMGLKIITQERALCLRNLKIADMQKNQLFLSNVDIWSNRQCPTPDNAFILSGMQSQAYFGLLSTVRLANAPRQFCDFARRGAFRVIPPSLQYCSIDRCPASRGHTVAVVVMCDLGRSRANLAKTFRILPVNASYSILVLMRAGRQVDPRCRSASPPMSVDPERTPPKPPEFFLPF